MVEKKRRELFYKKAYTCRFCGTPFEWRRLYPTVRGHVERWDEYFDIPVYEAEDSSGLFGDVLRVEVVVCPECAFASNEESRFITERPSGSWEPPVSVIDLVQRMRPARLTLSEEAEDVQRFPRSIDDAIVCLKLAIHSSTMIFNADPQSNPIESARLGTYALKAAQLSRQQEQEERELTWRKAALEYFRRAFEVEIKGVAHYRAVYQMGALSIYLSDDQTASRSFAYLRDLEEKEPGKELHKFVIRYKRIWQDREFHRAKVKKDVTGDPASTTP